MIVLVRVICLMAGTQQVEDDKNKKKFHVINIDKKIEALSSGVIDKCKSIIELYRYYKSNAQVWTDKAHQGAKKVKRLRNDDSGSQRFINDFTGFCRYKTVLIGISPVYIKHGAH